MVCTSAIAARTPRQNDTLDGGEVLPRFAIPIREVSAELDRTAQPSQRFEFVVSSFNNGATSYSCRNACRIARECTAMCRALSSV